MEVHQARVGVGCNATKCMGYCPTIVAGQAALAQGIDQAGNIEARLRSLVYTFVWQG